SCSAWPSADRPPSSTRATPGTVISCFCREVMAASSAAVRADPDLAATTGIGMKLAVPNGADRSIACWLGALAGRNLELLFCVTLDRAGNWVAAPIAAAIHT